MTATTKNADSSPAYTPRRTFNPRVRDPVSLPAKTIKIPPPPQPPPPPQRPNWFANFLPAALMLTGVFISAFVNAQNLYAFIPMMLMTLALPLSSYLNFKSQKKNYEQELSRRKKNYETKLESVQNQLNELAHKQRWLLEKIYPDISTLQKIALEANRHLWSRLPTDEDFLSLRAGIGNGQPTFEISLPQSNDTEDPLIQEAIQLAKNFQHIQHLPLLIPLADLGSLSIISQDAARVYGVAYRLVLDLLVHHSPQDVQVLLIANSRRKAKHWDWLKWLPHTGVLPPENYPNIAFNAESAGNLIKTLQDRYKKLSKNLNRENTTPLNNTAELALVVLVDDDGHWRHQMSELAKLGKQAGIYLIFLHEKNVPRECQARLEIERDRIHLKRAGLHSDKTEIIAGQIETASLEDCEQIARALAGWNVVRKNGQAILPQGLRLSEVLGKASMTAEAIQLAWKTFQQPQDLLRFPIGLTVHGEALEPAILNLLPGEYGGQDAYHTVLIGTTGSGKSEFMKSLVLGAAARYSPQILNFFFMDFKGGTAFNVLASLPHTAGFVTNLTNPALVNRMLAAIANEIKRRQRIFADENVKDIWEYNQKRLSDAFMPHLILLLDEFAKGLQDYPQIQPVLDDIARRGRSLGMYLFLANQTVNHQVEQLLPNVRGRIALMIDQEDIRKLLGRNLDSPVRIGQGYLYLSSGVQEPIEFQAGYAGFPWLDQDTAKLTNYSIYQVEPDGRFQEVWQCTENDPIAEKSTKSLKEEDFLLEQIQQAAKSMALPPARRIYLDPLPVLIPLENVLAESRFTTAFREGSWHSEYNSEHILTAWGKADLLDQCLQKPLQTDFNDKDGHLWIVGASNSGVDLALRALLTSLALCYPPDQVHFYLIEASTGDLATFESLPHTGAIIFPTNDNDQEAERLVRLLDFIEHTLQQRISQRRRHQKKHPPRPAIFIYINGMGALTEKFPDQVGRLPRMVKDGGPLGIHFVITSGRGREVSRSISGTIARRLVLRLSDKDDYLDLIGQQVSPLTNSAPGEGYWVDEDVIRVQIATPPDHLPELIRSMNAAWKGYRPTPIEALPTKLPLDSLLATQLPDKAALPIGKDFATLAPIWLPLADTPTCLIIGPRESGKSNFLACALASLLKQPESQNWQFRIYALRRSPLANFSSANANLKIFTNPNDVFEDIQRILQTLQEPSGIAHNPIMLLIDDLGYAYQSSREKLAKALDNLGMLIDEQENVYLLVSGLYEELRMNMVSPLLRLLRKNRTSIVFSRDPNETDWAGGVSIPLELRKKELPVGRGFLIHKGRLQLVQTPYLDV